MEYKDLLALVKKRRSMKKFKTDPLPDEYVEKIIEAARWAPSGANSQPWEFIVIKNPESKQPPVQRVALFIPHSGKNKEETACLQSLGFEPHA